MMGLAWCRGHVRATLCYGRGVAMACLVGWIRLLWISGLLCHRSALLVRPSALGFSYPGSVGFGEGCRVVPGCHSSDELGPEGVPALQRFSMMESRSMRS